MKHLLLLLGALVISAQLAAKLYTASWSVQPSEIFENQLYTLSLTFETDPDEEVTQFQITQGIARNADRQTREKRNNRSYTTFHWHEVSATDKLVAIPQSRVQVMLTRTYVQGFFRSSQSYSAQAQVPAFQYTISKLPGEAEGLPIGTFHIALSADKKSFQPGDVRELTVTLSAESGAIPDEVTFALAENGSGRCYPFRITEQSRTTCSAVARFVTEAETDFELTLVPFKAFDPKTRSVVSIAPKPLRFVRKNETAAEEETVMIGAEDSRSLALRFAPTLSAPIIATCPIDAFIPRESYKGWVRIESASGEGWVPETNLKGLTQ